MNFENYLNYIDEAILIIDNTYDIVSFNSAFLKLFPEAKVAAYAPPCLKICPEFQEIVLLEEPALEREIAIAQSRYAVSASTIYDRNGYPAAARSFVLTDVTDFGILAGAAKENIALLKKSNEALKVQKSDLEKQNLLKERLAAGQESDLILRELHDTLGHSLTVLHALSKLALIEGKTDTSAAHEYLKETQRLAKISLAELDTLDVLGSGAKSRAADIITFLYRLKQSMLSVSLDVALTITGMEEDCHGRLFYPVTRIVQEAATNCLRHSGATVFTVIIDFSDTRIRLEMEDNGTLLFGQTGLKRGNGLIGMEKRVLDSGGEIDMGITQSGGVRIRVVLPVAEY
jgi:signal transduction histidine kinase